MSGLNRKSHRYRQRRKSPKKPVAEIRQLAMKHPSFGYRRIWACLKRDGMKDQFEKSISVVEVGEIIIAETPTAQTASETDYRSVAEGGKSESGVDI